MIRLALIALVAAIGQTSQPAQVRRIHGIINKSETWSGTIVITDDVSIEQGDVTVEPGTIIEFAKAQPPGPALKIGSDRPNAGRILLKYEGRKPIIFRTRANTAPGTIRVELSQRITHARRPDGTIDAKEMSAPDDMNWRGARFDGLADPAVAIRNTSANATLSLNQCMFLRGGSLLIKMDAKTNLHVDNCLFSSLKQRVALEVIGSGKAWPETVFLQNNLLEGSIRLSGTSADLIGNIVNGPNASISIDKCDATGITVRNNYVHNTSPFDDGRYCLSCDAPDTRIIRNILSGGAFVVYHGSRHMDGNILIGSEKPSGMGAEAGRTQSLVARLPAGAIFERNILIGPAFSMLAPQPSWMAGPGKTPEAITIIRHNTFDGVQHTPRAIHLGEVGRATVTMEIYNNLFFRVECMLFDERASKNEVTVCDFNASAPEPAKRYDRARLAGTKAADPDWGKSDVRRNSIGEIGLLNLRDPLSDFNTDLLGRKITVEQALQQIGGYYRPASNSPLVRAGRHAPDSKILRETIGACEPAPATSSPAKP